MTAPETSGWREPNEITWRDSVNMLNISTQENVWEGDVFLNQLHMKANVP